MVFIFILPASIVLLYSNPLFHSGQATAQTMTRSSPNYLLYTDPEYGVTIQYPEDWQNMQIPENLKNVATNVLGTFGPMNSESIALFQPANQFVTVGISVGDLPENVTLDHYIKDVISSHEVTLLIFNLLSKMRLQPLQVSKDTM